VSGRALRLLGVAAIALVVLAATAVVALPHVLRRVVVWQVASATGRPVTLAALELELFSGRLALRDLRVADRDQGPLATVERLDVRFSPRALARGHFHVTEATLQAPAVRIVRTGPSEFNVSDLLARRPAAGPPPAITVDRLVLDGGSVVLEDRTLAAPRSWRVDGLRVEARGVSTRPDAAPGIVTLAAVAAGSPISVWASGVHLSPLRFHATVIARAVDASLAALYLPPGSPLSPARGTLDASATIEQDPATGARIGVDAVLGGVELRRPGQAAAFLTAPAVRLTVEELRVGPDAVALGRLAVDGGTVLLEDARLAPVRRWQAERIALEARNLSSARDAAPGVAVGGAVVAGSPLSVWVGNLRLAPLEAHATAIVRNVDLALFRLYLPPDLPVQPERGVVNASVRIDHDARQGTRLALDAGLAGVELRRPAHFVTAPALRLTAEDIGFAGGAVTVGRAAVSGDRLTLEDRTLTPARTWPVQNLLVEASRLSSRREDVQGVATARATVAGAAVSAWVTHVRLDPLELRATAILRNLDLALAQLYLPATVPLHVDRGVVNASLQVDHDVAAGTRLTGDATLSGVAARGRDAAGRLSVSAPSLRVTLADGARSEGALSVGRLEISGSGSVTDADVAGSRLDLQRLRLATEALTWPIRGPARVELSARLADGAEVDVHGTALLTAPPPTVAWTTELAVDVKTLDVAPLARYVPAAGGLRGRVNARLTTTLAYGAGLTARAHGEAGASRLALADGERTVLWLRQLEATGLDVEWPGRVGVGRLRVQRPRALVEIDRQGALALARRFAAPAAGPAPPADGPGPPAIAVGEVVIEAGRLALVDGRRSPAIRLDVPRVDVTATDVRWPGSTPAAVRLDATLPSGGTLTAEGSVIAEPASVDVRVAVADADLSVVQPYLPIRAGVRSRLDATLTVAGPLAPPLRLGARGNATLRSIALSDGQRAVLTLDRLAAVGIDAAWPERVTIERVRGRRSWALLERNREGRFLLRDLLAHVAPAAPATAPVPPAAPPDAAASTVTEFRVAEAVFEEGAATVADATTTPPAHIEIAGARLAVEDFTWPARGPVKLHVTSPMPGGGRLDSTGTLDLEPVRLQARASLDGVEIAPAQPYLPIEGRVAGRVTGDLAVAVTAEPLTVKIEGDARLQGFRLSDDDRPVVTVGRVEAAGLAVDWPARIAVAQVRLRRPSLLIERNGEGEFILRRLVTPRLPAPGPAADAPSGPAATPASPTVIEVATFALERAAARFVDHTTSPVFSEQLSNVNLTVTGLGTAPGHRTRFTGTGALGGGSTFTVRGEGTAGERPVVELKADLRDFPVARATPYLVQVTGWTATRGVMTAVAAYTLTGTRLEARHDVLLRQLDVARADTRDEVQERLGLPLGFLVSLLKDARGEIRLEVPVSGDLGTREFDFGEAVWGAVRNLAIRLLALPFSRVGSLFFSEDSRVEAVALAPIVFEPGSARLAPDMATHVERVAGFLRQTPSVTVGLAPIFTQADVDALERERVLARLRGRPGSSTGGDPADAARREYQARWPDRPVPPALDDIVAALAAVEAVPPEALRDLGARRLDVARQALTARGGVDPARLPGSARRRALVETTGAPRVELDLRP
jgi:hypothetical protein